MVDVAGRPNLAGAGLNMAQRVMDCGDAGHILVSKHMAEDLEHYGDWKGRLHDLGECEVKHGARVAVVNLYTEHYGNPEVPEKFGQAESKVKLLERFGSERTPASQGPLTREEKQASSRFKLSCRPEIDGCVQLVRWGERVWANYLRIKVEADSAAPVTNCTGFLTRIERNGEKKWGGNNVQLTFAHGDDPDTFSKTIRSKVPEWLDVLAVSSEKEIRIASKGRVWRYPPAVSKIFSETGEYVLTVTVIGDGVQAITALLKFNWTRNWQTSWLTLIPESSTQWPEPAQSWAISYEQETEMLEILKDSPKAAVMIMSTNEDRVGNGYAMRLVQVLRKAGMEIGQCVFEESWRLPTGVNVWASELTDNRQISKLRAAIKATNMECGDAAREPPTMSSPTRFEIAIMVKSSRT